MFTKGGGNWLDEIACCGADGVGLDWTVDIAAARAAVGARVALQGNLDPLVLLTDPATVAREASAIVRAAGPAPGHIFNLGHGIVPATNPDNVAALVEAVHTTSRETPRRCLICAARPRGNQRKAAPVLAFRGLDKFRRPRSLGALMHTKAASGAPG